MREIDKIALIHVRDGQILMTRSIGKSTYYIPGGKREMGESDEEALIREIVEELNVSIRHNTIEYVGTFKAQADGANTGVIVKMTCYKAEYDGIAEPTSEIDEVKWLNYTDLDKVSEVDKIIFEYLKEQGELQ